MKEKVMITNVGIRDMIIIMNINPGAFCARTTNASKNNEHQARSNAQMSRANYERGDHLSLRGRPKKLCKFEESIASYILIS